MDDETLARRVNEPEGEERSSSPLQNEAPNEDTAAANSVITTGLQVGESVQSPPASNNSDSAFDVSPDNPLAALNPPAYDDSASAPPLSSQSVD